MAENPVDIEKATYKDESVSSRKGSRFRVSGDEDANQYLSITADRNGNAFYSCFHNVTAMVGAGVLGLPNAMIYLTWSGGVITLVLSTIISYWTFWQLVHLHEQGEEPNVKRCDRYHELCAYAFGSEKKGKWSILPFQLGIFIGLPITYTVTGANALHQVHLLLAGPGSPSLSIWIVVFSAVQLFLSQVPDFNKLAVVSLMGAIMSLSYSMIAFGTSASRDPIPDVQYNLNGYSTASGLFGAFNALATFAFAYGGHNVAMEIQATMPHPPSTVKRMMVGVNAAYIVTPLCYFTVAISGYYAFGNTVQSPIFLSLLHPKWVIVWADIMIVFHVLASYQVYAFPVYDMIEKLQLRYLGLKPNAWLVRIPTRCIFVCFTCFVAALIPFFGDLMGLIGALAITPTTYAMPNILWLVIKKPPKTSFHFWACCANLVLCFLVFSLGTIGAVRNIIVDAHSYGVFQ